MVPDAGSAGSHGRVELHLTAVNCGFLARSPALRARLRPQRAQRKTYERILGSVA
jgi:hypothetical protein